jgi:hypothetical protein
MKKNIALTILHLFIAASLIHAQVAATKKPTTTFTSVYTDLKTECGSGMTPKEEKAAEAAGQDIPAVCKGYGGYEIFIASDGANTQFQVRTKTRKAEKDVMVSEDLYVGDGLSTRKVEWRLADGKPFAVIFRIDVWGEADEQGARKKLGEQIRVVGLKNKSIEFKVDVKTKPNPNEEARRLADNGYAK